MSAQNYKSHAQLLKGYHFIGFGLLILSLGWSVRLIIRTWGTENVEFSFVLLILTVVVGLAGYYSRVFPLKAQDRVIRLEENLRYHRLHGTFLPDELSVRQIIGLRFASDEELQARVQDAVDKNLSEDDIKKSIGNWRADEYRV